MTDDLPKEVGRGVVQIGPVEIEVIQLDNGQRLIAPESLVALLTWLGHDAGPMAEAVGDIIEAETVGGPEKPESANG